MTKTDAPKPLFLFSGFNLIVAIIVVIGMGLTLLRFAKGLSAVTHLDDNTPWGLWVGFDLLCGIALAAGGYVTTGACYIMGLKQYQGAVRPAILTALLGYTLEALCLCYDLGRPWRFYYPLLVTQGTSSLLFQVVLCLFLYLLVLFLEYSPAFFEYLGWQKVRQALIRLTVALTICGVLLATLHQSSLGALFLIAPSKLHPLWYSAYLPVYFFVSSLFAGMSAVILEGALTHRFLSRTAGPLYLSSGTQVAFGFGRASAFVMAADVLIQLVGLAADHDWALLASPWGLWYLLEIGGFVALPAFCYALGVRERNLSLIRWAALWTALGVMFNRLNVCLIAFNWQLPLDQRYFPSWMEAALTIFFLTLGLVAYRFMTLRMPILYEHPDYKT